MGRAVEIRVSDRQRARRWRTRWAENEEGLAAADREGASDKDLANLLASLLADDKRAGKPLQAA